MKQVQMQPSNDWYKNNPTFTQELFKSDLVNEQNINAWVDLTFPNTGQSYRDEWHMRAKRGTFFINMDNNSLAEWKQLVEGDIVKKYKVAVEVTEIQFWEVEANSIDKAMDSWLDGDHVSTKPKQDLPLEAEEMVKEGAE